jgi:hypothetical protein
MTQPILLWVIKNTTIYILYDLRFPQCWLWRVPSSGIWRHIVCWAATDVSEEHIASIFRVEGIIQQEPARHSSSISWIVESEALTAVAMKSTIFWDVTPCSSLKVNWRFRGLPPNFTLVSSLAYSSALKMKVICSSETSVDFQWTTQHYISEDSTLYILGCMPVDILNAVRLNSLGNAWIYGLQDWWGAWKNKCEVEIMMTELQCFSHGQGADWVHSNCQCSATNCFHFFLFVYGANRQWTNTSWKTVYLIIQLNWTICTDNDD